MLDAAFIVGANEEAKEEAKEEDRHAVADFENDTISAHDTEGLQDRISVLARNRPSREAGFRRIGESRSGGGARLHRKGFSRVCASCDETIQLTSDERTPL